MSASRAANQAVRELFYKLGKEYDITRGFKPFSNNKDIYIILKYFNYKCCYCRKTINSKDFDKDHLIPMNKEGGGLHSWGNVVPSCGDCNGIKQGIDWILFINSQRFTKSQTESRIRRIKAFTARHKYNLNPVMSLGISNLATKLYMEISNHTTLQLIKSHDEGKRLFR